MYNIKKKNRQINKLQKNEYKIIKECLICNKKFEIYRSREKTAKYCSDECRIIAMKQLSESRKQRLIKVCEICKHSFEVVKSCENQRFCSNTCRGIDFGRSIKGRKFSTKHKENMKHTDPNCQCCFCKGSRGELKGTNSSSYKNGSSMIVPKVCMRQECGKSFVAKNSRKFCSRTCANLFIWQYTDKRKKMSEKLKDKPLTEETKRKLRENHADFSGPKNGMFGVHRFGKESPRWIDGRSYEDYPKEFTELLKEQIRKRDNYECQNCEMVQEEHFIVYGRNLHIHHIDYNRKNCHPLNLITLCQGCNLRANQNRDYWLDYYTEKIKHIYQNVQYKEKK